MRLGGQAPNQAKCPGRAGAGGRADTSAEGHESVSQFKGHTQPPGTSSTPAPQGQPYHHSQFMSDHFQAELRFLGMASSPAFVREPEGNGCAERFIRTLKEQLLWIDRFDSVEALRLALLAFKDRYNREWLIERHGHQTPAAVRAAFAADVAA